MQLTPQIDIVINNECNAHCRQCIQEITAKMWTEVDNAFLEGVTEHVRDFHALGGRKIIITGGEPTLRVNRVLKVLDVLRQYNDLDLVAMYTNGSRLLQKIGDRTVAEQLRSAELQFVNFSVHHWDVEKNNAIFVMSKDDPIDVARHLRQIGQRFRFCATIQKSGLETTDDVVRYLEYAEECGAESVYLRELFTLTGIDRESASRPENVDYATLALVPIGPIVADCQLRFEQVEIHANFQGRNKHETEFRTPGGMPFFFSRLEIGNEDKEKLPYLVVMPNGHLYSTWHGETARVESLRNFGR